DAATRCRPRPPRCIAPARHTPRARWRGSLRHSVRPVTHRTARFAAAVNDGADVRQVDLVVGQSGAIDLMDVVDVVTAEAVRAHPAAGVLLLDEHQAFRRRQDVAVVFALRAGAAAARREEETTDEHRYTQIHPPPACREQRPGSVPRPTTSVFVCVHLWF